MFKKILVANRGEIAVRVIRSAHEMDVKAVALYSDADRDALHVAFADEAVHIGPSAPSESYLSIEKVIQAAKKTKAEAIHPGYGFLSENAELPRACKQAGITFIGPSAENIEAMGGKTEARALMEEAGVPIVPGSGILKDIKDAKSEAARIGYPVMLKAKSGGGGKGMRVIESEKELASAFEMARSEAGRAFGDDSVYFEKYLEDPHHIEVQILADEKTVIHLGERECSVQRRHQKVIEESPSPFVTPELRDTMTKVACQAVRHIGYRGAGTLEFLVDKNRNHYFLEMNTRLQVEHPVTEMVTGTDLVKEQLRIAAGEGMSLRQEDIQVRGHAIEGRVYAEDPDAGFVPSPGKIKVLRLPDGPGIRNDIGVREHGIVPPDYDPILGKLIAWAATRNDALARFGRALEEYRVLGIRTTLPFLARAVAHESFKSGVYDTGFIDKYRDELLAPPQANETAALVASAIALYEQLNRAALGGASKSSVSASAWKLAARRSGLRSR